MSDPNLPFENRLKGKFKGLLDRLMGADRLRNSERPRLIGSRLEVMTLTLADSILTRFRSTFTRALEVTGRGTSPVRVYNAQINSSAHIHCLWESQNVMQGAHDFIITDATLYVAHNVCIVTTALMI
jgi:hypothetical protein